MKDLTWKKLSSTYLIKDRWATLRKDVCELPDGRVKDDYYVLEYPNWASVVALTEEGKVLMVRQYRHAAGIVSLEIPGGVIEKGEEPEAAIRRELLEETGYVFEKFESLGSIYPNPSTSTNVTYNFLATGGKKVAEQSLDEHEEILIEEYTIEEIKQLLASHQIPQALHVTALFYALWHLRAL
ncbi:NUDIX hydrolase [Mucilaginibacter sp. RS28]|uniref:GDP-mannose pyrophosphatase n=1 Tax=Mucilaginibacter straminoryzae TaxID=2932774 RepID=A0A9X1X035_9SPHI|nr:NUDIX hydrolase [Mucilaginibacter straminoryzae]MCJ8208797.1 NUDIX hydrolase [Mucilaginibacter straminoryzae]